MALSSPEDFVGVVRSVLPALNIRPESLQLGAEAVARARSRGSWTRALRGVRQILVYVGTMSADQADDALGDAAAAALGMLTDAARDECEDLVVVWDGPKQQARAAAYSLTPQHELGQLLGTSWTDPSSWTDPMVDASKPLGDTLEDALGRLRHIVQSDPKGHGFDEELARALVLTDVALRAAGGEGQDTSERPGAAASPEEWGFWLTQYELSVRDEWHRVRGDLASARVRVAGPTAEGRLSGTRVFLSYARPDATSIARPVFEALRSLGADVWFDQEKPLESGWLDVGLAATIESCEVYVLCASDEFFERAGYATQEVAWAVEKWRGRSPLRSIVVVARPDTVLPTIAKRWPVVGLSGTSVQNLGEALASAIRHAVPPDGTSVALTTAGVPQSVLPPLDAEAEPATLITRVRHRQRLYELPVHEVARIVGTSDRDAGEMQVAGRLRQVGVGLDWDGHLVGYADWPDDPATRAYRWMLGSSRALASVRWPLSGSLDDADDIAEDVGILAEQVVPALEWPVGACWGDEERRLLVRFHLGVLRVLEQLLRRGLWGGLLKVPSHMLDHWQDELPGRRRECIDTLVDLRLLGGLSWRADPPIWDKLYEHWRKILAQGGVYPDTLPAEVRLAVTGQAQTFAAMASQVTCHAARVGRAAAQRFRGGTRAQPTICAAWAGSSHDRVSDTLPGDRCVVMELSRDEEGKWNVCARWSGFEAGDGAAAIPAPAALSQAMNFSRA